MKKYENMSKAELLKVIGDRRTQIPAPEQDEEKYRTLIEGLKDVVFRVSLKGILEYVSPALKEFGGYDADKEVGNHIKKFFEKKIELSETLKRLKQLTKNRKTTLFEFMFKPADGAAFPVEITSKPLIKENRVVGLQCVMRNISDRRAAEEEKRALEEKLVQAEKMEALGRLAGGLAHDLNNILSAVVSYPDLLLMKLPEDSPLYQPLLTIQKSGQKASTIVEDLLIMARRRVKRSQVVNLNSIVLEYLESPDYEKLKRLYPSLRIETNFENDLLPILGSSVHLVKVVANLVSNAAEALPGNGIGLITVSTLNLYPAPAAAEYDLPDYVVLSILDNGVGIAPEDLKRMFEPFYIKKIMGRSGTGLGMAVVWGTVLDHDGFINVNSRLGKGTTFELYFPVTKEAVPVEAPRIPVDEYVGNGEEIVVVDDVKEQREIISMILKRLKYRVFTFSSGEAAIEYIKSNPVDMVILDMIMGAGMDGLDTYRKIIEIRPNIKSLIVSGFSETDRVKETQRLGAGEYLSKPFTMEQLGVAVKKELARSKK